MGSLRVGHDWATSLSLFTFMHWRRKWQPAPVFLHGESQGWGNLVGSIYGVARSQTRLKWLSSSSSKRQWILFSSARGTFTKVDHIFGQKESILAAHKAKYYKQHWSKLEIYSYNNKYTHLEINFLLNNSWIKGENISQNDRIIRWC